MENYDYLKERFNWNDGIIKEVVNIFQKYHEKLSNSENPSLGNLEFDIKDMTGIGYQEFKDVILFFWENEQYRDVCIAFKNAHDVFEFKNINK